VGKFQVSDFRFRFLNLMVSGFSVPRMGLLPDKSRQLGKLGQLGQLPLTGRVEAMSSF
jgi:hypothetical protein